MRPNSPETRRPATRKSRTPRAYHWCDGLSEAVIYFMVIFAPWALGTTHNWAIWTMNCAGYVLGLLLIGKWIIRWRAEYQPARWGVDEEESPSGPARALVRAAAVLTVLILLYCLISVLNARATYVPAERRFIYHDFIAWLPHSYDRYASFQALCNFAALAWFFWALRDWLLGKRSRERRERRDLLDPEFQGLGAEQEMASSNRHVTIPSRLRCLLWVLCINGSLLALEGILQRLDGTNKLLWTYLPRFNRTADSQFGTYAYRSNAAQYFNLVWPVCFGFWLMLRREHRHLSRAADRLGSGSHIILLPLAVLMAACPIISTSRGGALISVAVMLAALTVLMISTRREDSFGRVGLLTVFLVTLLFAGFLGWAKLEPRLQKILEDDMSGRTEIYTNSVQIAQDFPLFGTGANTFATIAQLYREPGQRWQAYVHDDWLETRITLGWVGFATLMVLLAIVLAHWKLGLGAHANWAFVALLWLALGGCLAHAKYDFPFQIYSLQFTFLLICSMLFALSAKRVAANS